MRFYLFHLSQLHHHLHQLHRQPQSLPQCLRQRLSCQSNRIDQQCMLVMFVSLSDLCQRHIHVPILFLEFIAIFIGNFLRHCSELSQRYLRQFLNKCVLKLRYNLSNMHQHCHQLLPLRQWVLSRYCHQHLLQRLSLGVGGDRQCVQELHCSLRCL